MAGMGGKLTLTASRKEPNPIGTSGERMERNCLRSNPANCGILLGIRSIPLVSCRRQRGAIEGLCSPLAGFAVSMTGLALVTYIECYKDFTSLVQQGY